MSRFEQWEKVDLQSGAQRFPVNGGFFTNDALGNRLGLVVTNGNEPVTLTGTIKGLAKLPPHTDDDVQIFELTGVISGNTVYVDLTEECYYYSGPMTVAIRNIDGDITTTLASFVGFVDAATDGTVGIPTPGGGGGGYVIDDTPTSGSDHLVKSGGVYSAIQMASQNSSAAVNALAETVDGIDDRVETLETTITTKADASDLSNYVRTNQYATGIKAGIVRPGSGFSGSGGGTINISKATSIAIKAGTNYYNPIVPYNQHEAVFYGLAKAAGDTSQASSDNAVGAYTEDAKTAIKAMLDITDTDLSGLTSRIATAESSIVTLQTDTTALENSLGSLSDDLDALESTVTGLGTRLTTAESSVTGLGTRLTTAEGNITSLGSRLTTAEGNITSHGTSISGLDTRVTALENGQGPSYVIDNVPTSGSNNLVKSGGVYDAVNTVSGNVSTLSTSVSTLSTSVNQMQSSVSNNTSGISLLESRVSYLETNLGANVEDITADVTMTKSSGTNVNLIDYEMYKAGHVVTFSITMRTTATVNAGTVMAYIDVTGAPVPVINPRAFMYYGSTLIFGNYDKVNNRIAVTPLSANLASNSAFMLTFVYVGSDEESEPTASTNGITFSDTI